MESWYREQLIKEYGAEYVQEMDDATVRLAEKDSPASGPTGECPHCNGPLVYLHRQDVHYCAMCDVEYKEVDIYGKPVVE